MINYLKKGNVMAKYRQGKLGYNPENDRSGLRIGDLKEY